MKGNVEHILVSSAFCVAFLKELPDRYSMKVFKNREDLGKVVDIKLPK